jgi:hypothetical protein
VKRITDGDKTHAKRVEELAGARERENVLGWQARDDVVEEELGRKAEKQAAVAVAFSLGWEIDIHGGCK